MPRKGPAKKHVLDPDPIYGNRLAQRFINRMMVDGKKAVAEKIFYESVDRLGERAGRPGIEVFEQAVRNVMPVVEVKPRRVGGATYQVPVEVRAERRTALALRWIVTNARKRGGKGMVEKLTAELYDASNGQGASVKRKEDGHRMAEANKAFAHYRY